MVHQNGPLQLIQFALQMEECIHRVGRNVLIQIAIIHTRKVIWLATCEFTQAKSPSTALNVLIVPGKKVIWMFTSNLST